MTAISINKTKAEVVRKALEEGLNLLQPSRSNSAQVLLDLAKKSKKYNLKGPKDLSKNLDKYTWGKVNESNE